MQAEKDSERPNRLSSSPVTEKTKHESLTSTPDPAPNYALYPNPSAEYSLIPNLIKKEELTTAAPPSQPNYSLFPNPAPQYSLIPNLTPKDKKSEYALIPDFSKINKNYDSNKAQINKNLPKSYFEQAVTLHDKALEESSKKNYNEAIKIFTTAIELYPTTDFYCNRGIVQRNLSNFDLALADFDKSINLDKGNIRPYYNKGYTYYEKKDYLTTVKVLSTVIEKDPDHRFAFYLRGRARIAMRQWLLATTDFRSAVNLASQDGDIVLLTDISLISLNLADNLASSISESKKDIQKPKTPSNFFKFPEVEIKTLKSTKDGQTEKKAPPTPK